VHRFTLDPDIGILIMDEKGAVGVGVWACCGACSCASGHCTGNLTDCGMSRLDTHCILTEPLLLLSLMFDQVGLDLSFVSHVFLMEPIANRSTEQQVRQVHCNASACSR
jgi:hypothetical protein